MRAIRLSGWTVALLMGSWGISWANFKWDLGGTVTTSYDDNVTYVKTDRISDVITRASLGGGFTQEGKTYMVDFRGILTENVFARHSSFDNFSQNLSLDARKDLTDYDHLSAKETFRHTEEPYSFEDAFGRTNGRYGSYSNRLNLEYSHEITRQWTAKLKYLQRNDNFTRQGLSDSAGYAPGIETDYVIDSMTRAMLGYDYTRSFFDPGKDASDHTIFCGLRRYLTNQWYVDLKSGIDFINAFDDRNFTKPRYEVGLTHELDQNTQLNVKYVDQYAIGSFSADVFKSWRWVISGVKQLTARLKANIDAFYGKGEYLTNDISDKLSGADLGVQYALSERTSLKVSYLYERTDSNVDSREYTRNMILFGFMFAF